jgi:hypothetical protein
LPEDALRHRSQHQFAHPGSAVGPDNYHVNVFLFGDPVHFGPYVAIAHDHLIRNTTECATIDQPPRPGMRIPQGEGSCMGNRVGASDSQA